MSISQHTVCTYNRRAEFSHVNCLHFAFQTPSFQCGIIGSFPCRKDVTQHALLKNQLYFWKIFWTFERSPSTSTKKHAQIPTGFLKICWVFCCFCKVIGTLWLVFVGNFLFLSIFVDYYWTYILTPLKYLHSFQICAIMQSPNQPRKIWTMTINERNLEKYVDNLLKLVAFKRKLIGCEYLKHAILLKCSCDNNRARLNKDIYPKVAEMFCTANTNVERAIRNAILDCHRNGCLIELNSIFGHPIVHKNYPPTNGELICTIATELQGIVRENEGMMPSFNISHHRLTAIDWHFCRCVVILWGSPSAPSVFYTFATRLPTFFAQFCVAKDNGVMCNVLPMQLQRRDATRCLLQDGRQV